MRYCKKCVQPDTRPGIFFSEDGICGACLYEEEKKHIDWTKRDSELREMAKWATLEARSRKCNYDCAIGISGGKDSTFQALYARDKLGLHPLLVNSEPEGITEIGRKNIENLKNLGFDVISLRPNPKTMKQLVKKDFYEFLNPVKVTEFSLWASTYIIADKFNIPLIIQGENPGLTLGARKTAVGINGDALNADRQDTLSSGWERYIDDRVTDRDLFMFHYDREAIKSKSIRGVWLQYYTKEWSQPGNAAFSIKHGLTVRTDFDPEDIGTYVPYSQMDSDLVQVNQTLKYYKFGFGQCTDHACYDIREGLIDREKGIMLVEKYDGKCAERYVQNFCDYISISTHDFWNVVEKFVNRKLFYKDADTGKWKPLFKVGHDFISE
jgi:N-acetyl sugar amidotransferase